CATGSSAEWIAFGGEHNVPIAPVNTPKTIADDPQFRARFPWYPAARHGADMLPFPVRFSGEELPEPSKAPGVGDHTEAVLREVLGGGAGPAQGGGGRAAPGGAGPPPRPPPPGHPPRRRGRTGGRARPAGSVGRRVHEMGADSMPWKTLAALSIVLAVTASRADPQPTEPATFAGGCFWCMQPPFETLPGVISTTVGYTGGHTKNPTYEEVSAGDTGHAESVEIVYDPARIRYEQLLDVFWRNIDPIIPEGQL